MEQTNFAKRIGALRKDTHLRINNTHIWCSLAIIALRHSLNDEEVLNQQEFAVPSSRPNKTVPRQPEKVRAIISGAVDRELYSSVLAYVVAQVEAFLNDVVVAVLIHDSRRLKAGVRGLDLVRTIDVSDIVDSLSKEELIKAIVNKVVASLFYARPAIQFDYFEKVIGVEIRDTLKTAWIELKATRDLIVHNSGTINEVYLQKCGTFARGQLNDAIEIDKEYFEQSIANAKSLVGCISSQLQRSFGPTKKERPGVPEAPLPGNG